MSQAFVQTANQIVSGAFRICGIHAAKQALDLDDFNHGLDALNVLMNALMEEDSGIWRQTWATKTLPSTSAVSNGGKYYRCVREHTSAATDEPGTGADWTTYWYEDSGVSGSAVAWVVGTDYTCAGDFQYTNAFSIAKAFLRYQDFDRPILLADFGEFLDTADKTNEDIPRVLYFDRQNTSRIFLYPIPNSDVIASGVIHFLQISHIVEATGSTDNITIPPGWVRAMKYLLAADIADESGVGTAKANRIQSKAEFLWKKCRRGPHTSISQVKGALPCFRTVRKVR